MNSLFSSFDTVSAILLGKTFKASIPSFRKAGDFAQKPKSELKAIGGENGERSRLTQCFEYNYGDFIPILRLFLRGRLFFRGYLKICKEVKDRRLQLFILCSTLCSFSVQCKIRIQVSPVDYLHLYIRFVFYSNM